MLDGPTFLGGAIALRDGKWVEPKFCRECQEVEIDGRPKVGGNSRTLCQACCNGGGPAGAARGIVKHTFMLSSSGNWETCLRCGFGREHPDSPPVHHKPPWRE